MMSERPDEISRAIMALEAATAAFARMPDRPGEFSRAIGALEATTAALAKSFDRHCDDDDRRHSENLQQLRHIADRLGESSRQIAALAETVKPLAKTVAAMEPVVANWNFTRGKIAAWGGIGLCVLAFLGWVVEALVKAAATWMLSRFN